jgi:hypothetical protein
MTIYWINLGRPGLTANTHTKSGDHDNPIETDQNKLWNSISNEPNVEGWNCKKIIKKRTKKNNLSQSGLTCQTHDLGYEIKMT